MIVHSQYAQTAYSSCRSTVASTSLLPRAEALDVTLYSASLLCNHMIAYVELESSSKARAVAVYISSVPDGP